MTSCTLFLAVDGQEPDILPMTRQADLFSITVQTPAHGCLLWYTFQIEDAEGKTLWLGCASGSTGGESRLVHAGDPNAYQITVYEPARTPDWFIRSFRTHLHAVMIF